MHSARRSCQSAFKSSTTVCPFANVSRRAFSRSSVHQRGALPVFLTPSSPELSALLSTLNAKVFLPQHLTSDQQKLVYKQESRAKLESEPIEISLGDVTLPLEHIDRNRDLPDRGRQFREIVKQSKTPEDWENVLRMMEGYEDAGIHLKPQWKELALRKMSNAGMQHVILKALQRSRASGLRLKDWAIVQQVMSAVRDRASSTDWDAAELKKALSMAEQVVELMENKEHLGKTSGVDDHRTNPAVIAMPLEMAAELAYRHDGDVEKVKKYALRLMTALKQHNFVDTTIQKANELAAATYKNKAKQAQGLAQLSHTLYPLIPIWNGLSTTRTVLDEQMPMAEDAEKIQQQVHEALLKGVEGLEKLRIRDGQELSKDGPDGYVGYVKEAMRRCEDAEEEE